MLNTSMGFSTLHFYNQPKNTIKTVNEFQIVNFSFDLHRINYPHFVLLLIYVPFVGSVL